MYFKWSIRRICSNCYHETKSKYPHDDNMYCSKCGLTGMTLMLRKRKSYKKFHSFLPLKTEDGIKLIKIEREVIRTNVSGCLSENDYIYKYTSVIENEYIPENELSVYLSENEYYFEKIINNFRIINSHSKWKVVK